MEPTCFHRMSHKAWLLKYPAIGLMREKVVRCQFARVHLLLHSLSETRQKQTEKLENNETKAVMPITPKK
jgi:hypothetical protein